MKNQSGKIILQLDVIISKSRKFCPTKMKYAQQNPSLI